ncbi:MAG: aspartate/glutamate racemase family protein [Pleomorphochaeta sp.]
MKSIALIHTVKPILNSFSKTLKEKCDEELEIFEIYDDYLASNPNEIGYFSKDNKKRLYNDIENCCLAGVSIIVTTCSTLTPIIEELRPFFNVPIVAIDDEMGKIAVSKGTKIRVLATAESTIAPTVSKLNKEAKKINKKIEIVSSFDNDAYEAMKSGHLKEHDEKLLKVISEIKDFDVIVLAQASMAHLAKESKKYTNIDVIGSIDTCQQKVLDLIKGL